MKKEELQHKILSEINSRNLKAVFFSKNQSMLNDAKITSIFVSPSTDDVLATLYTRTYYRTVRFFSLHFNRYRKILDEIVSNKIIGYTDESGKSKFINGFETDKVIKQFVQTDNDKIHINDSENEWRSCVYCGAIIFNDDDYLELNHRIICENCKSNTQIKRCDVCNQEHFRFDLRAIRPTPEMLEYFKKQPGTMYVCDSCIDEEFQTCDICGQFELKGSRNTCDCRSHRILDYCYKPRRPKLLSIKNIKKNTLFLGFENECECKRDVSSSSCDYCDYSRGDDACDDCDHYDDDETDKSCYPEILVAELGQNVYCKDDGSLDNGFEIVTEPMTYGYILANKDKFTEAFKRLVNAGAYSFNSDTTGFHIHLSKAAFKDKTHMLNFAKIIYEDEKFSSKIAQRSGNSYCYYLNDEDKKHIDDTIKRCIERGGDRYRAVNFNNTNTVEVRIYKGNLAFDSCLIYIQHVVSIFHYTALATKLNKAVSVLDYINYVNKRGKIYKELKNRIAKIIKGGK